MKARQAFPKGCLMYTNTTGSPWQGLFTKPQNGVQMEKLLKDLLQNREEDPKQEQVIYGHLPGHSSSLHPPQVLSEPQVPNEAPLGHVP